MSLHCCKPAQTIGMLITDNKRLCGGNSLSPARLQTSTGKIIHAYRPTKQRWEICDVMQRDHVTNVKIKPPSLHPLRLCKITNLSLWMQWPTRLIALVEITAILVLLPWLMRPQSTCCTKKHNNYIITQLLKLWDKSPHWDFFFFTALLIPNRPQESLCVLLN